MADQERRAEDLRYYQQQAEALGISLQEYLLLRIYEMLEDIKLDTGCIE